MESPSPTVRRRAWINSSRQWVNQEGPDSDELPCILPSASLVDDDVFSDVSTGCFTGKIENWLLACGSEVPAENSPLSFESVLKAQKTDEDLDLGADASVLTVGELTFKNDFPQFLSTGGAHGRCETSTPRQSVRVPSLNLGHSGTSSCLSSFASNAPSSVSDVLRLCSEDAEDTLYHLGFGSDEPQVTVRIPPRFFTFPSVALGINFRLFLDSQLQRIREEDPGLSLASRFRQVQVLTEMANAFYSLYSHVSRTPVQKLATPEFSFSSSPVERMGRFRGSVRSEPRSPVERLKDTVSKMCLYTGSPRGSDSTSPQPSPKKRPSLPDVVDVVLEKVKTRVTKKLELEGKTGTDPGVDMKLMASHGANTETGKSGERVDELDSGSRTVWASVSSSLSGETVIEADQLFKPELDARTAEPSRVDEITHDLICPQVSGSRHSESSCTGNPKPSASLPARSGTEHTDRSELSPCVQAAVPEPDEDSHTTGSLPVSSPSQCSITVRGGDGDGAPPSNAPDSGYLGLPLRGSCEGGQSLLPNPAMHQGLSPVTVNLQQASSFELEEVASAGEEDYGQSEVTRTTSLLPNVCYHKGDVVRNDSLHSDSSGYAEEEVSPSHR
ncbi:protein TESPA1 [Nelusetta ayraudi]|uniref:protein TESPA1 n=1 Tax=Nelusetta ayraudi TaxID=303726 RepID=UPI003F6E5D80